MKLYRYSFKPLSNLAQKDNFIINLELGSWAKRNLTPTLMIDKMPHYSGESMALLKLKFGNSVRIFESYET